MLEVRLLFWWGALEDWRLHNFFRGGCGVSCLLRVNGFRVVSRVSWRLEAAGRPWDFLSIGVCRGTWDLLSRKCARFCQSVFEHFEQLLDR
jgi:hypothetical protein